MSVIPKPKKSLGQHWLNDHATLNEICDLAELNNEDIVLEIGPGYGTLTKILIQKANKVVAIELDSNLALQLKTFVDADNLTVVNESILKFDLTKLPVEYKVVANIPYYLTSNLLRLLSESSNPPSVIVLLIQKEVAERVGAKAGDMSLLSVTTQYFWEVNLSSIVKAKLFTPPPKVDSQIILLKRRRNEMFPNTDNKKFFRLVRIGFSSRRKTILNSMSNGLRIDKGIVGEILIESKIDPGLRPQMLSLDKWHDLYEVSINKGII